MKIKTETFDLVVLQSMNNMQFIEAKNVANGMIEASHMKPAKKVRLKMSIERAPDVKQISTIMWNAYLSGDGHSSLDSNWNR